jgi:hypothetical protein
MAPAARGRKLNLAAEAIEMIEKDDGTGEIAAFERYLEAHGASPERWSEAARRRFLPLLEREAHAIRLMREARSLERLLDRASAPSPERVKALADRIISVAMNEAKHRADAAVIDLSSRRTARRHTDRSRSAAGWKIASALAASLIAGIFLGNAPPVVSAVEAVADTVGLSERTDVASLAFFDEGGAGDEDVQ